MVCAVQHEPPRVPLTTRPNPRPAPGTEPISAGHPRMGHPAVPATALLLGCCRAFSMRLRPRGASLAWPQWDRQLPVLPGRSTFGISGCSMRDAGKR